MIPPMLAPSSAVEMARPWWRSNHGASPVLIDVVDLAYYGASLHQLDLCFVRADLVTEKLRPDISRFDGALWRQLT